MDYQGFISTIENFSQDYQQNISAESFFGFPLRPILEAETKLSSDAKNIAYFSMEYGLAPSIYHSLHPQQQISDDNLFTYHHVFSNVKVDEQQSNIRLDKMLDLPIYSGGLGVLAGDTMKSLADEQVSVVGLGILWRKGYFKQKFWYECGQISEELSWDPSSYPGLIPLKNKVVMSTQEGDLHLRLWKYYTYSFDKQFVCPLVLLDANLPENVDYLRSLTGQLYRSDDVWWNIFQRSILGVGGMRALDSLGYNIDQYHLNEGHAAFALVEKNVNPKDQEGTADLKNQFIYTCHTPVEAGHDRFAVDDVLRVLPKEYVEAAHNLGQDPNEDHLINLTQICLEHSRQVNAVAQKHGEIMHVQFPKYKEKIQAITNGIHIPTWISDPFKNLFNKHKESIGNWEEDPACLKNVLSLKDDEQFRQDIFAAHQTNKKELLQTIQNWGMREDVLTIAWARRIAGYKRPALIFQDLKRLLKVAYDSGPIQFIIAGKAHPNDDVGGALIKEILNNIEELKDHTEVIKILIIENYDTYFGKLLTSSVDVWLNNPLPPFEASGTSGMKAVLNGVVQLTTLDGWVVEAAEEDLGWIFGYQHHGLKIGSESELRLDEDANALYNTLQEAVKMYYQTNQDGQINIQSAWIDKMIQCIATSSFFNTNRMVQQYKKFMWNL